MIIILQIITTILVADFVSGLIHWLEDSYGREDSPVIGRLFIQPNILHHHQPRHFVRKSWFQSSWDLMLGALLLISAAAFFHVLNWQIALFAVLSANANEFHKWAHRTRKENGRLISFLQDLRILQTPRHHARHHARGKDTHYCVITNVLNPALEKLRFWRGLEWLLNKMSGLQKRPDPSVPKAATARLTNS